MTQAAVRSSVREKRITRSITRWLVSGLTFAATGLSAVGISSAVADTSLWQVSRDGEQVLLGGTLHVLRPSHYPLPEEFQQAFEASDRLVLETDMQQLHTPSNQRYLQRVVAAADGERAREVLSPATWQAFSEAWGDAGLPSAALSHYKVSFLLLLMTNHDMDRMGFSAHGLDAHFDERARSMDMPVIGLESAREQFDMMATLVDGKEDEAVRQMLAERQVARAKLQQMASAWRAGDMEGLWDIVEADMTLAPEMWHRLLVERNHSWMPQIERLFEEPGTEYLLVGAAHLVGPEGLLNLLRQRGYEVRPL